MAARWGPQEAPKEAQQPGQVQLAPPLALPSPRWVGRKRQKVVLWPLQEAAGAVPEALVPGQVAAGEGVTAAEPTVYLWLVVGVAVAWFRGPLRACGGV